MPKIPGNHEPEPMSQRPWEKPEAIESDADYRRAKAAEKWFAQKKHLEGLGKRKP